MIGQVQVVWGGSGKLMPGIRPCDQEMPSQLHTQVQPQTSIHADLLSCVAPVCSSECPGRCTGKYKLKEAGRVTCILHEADQGCTEGAIGVGMSLRQSVTKSLVQTALAFLGPSVDSSVTQILIPG